MRIHRISIFALVVITGCATTSQPEPADLTALEPIAEKGLQVAGPWTPLEDGITNMVPSDAAVQEGQVRDGTGVSTAVVKGFKAQDIVAQATVVFDGTGAPSLVFRASEKDGVITDMYSVALYGDGVNIWRMRDGQWVLLEAKSMPLQARTPYTLRVTAKDERILVFVNDEQTSELIDESHVVEGRAGIRAIEGPCKISDLRVSKH
ncbi:MAG: hypothetical protein SGI88_03355 [Candidatus Hydrogenedentes bacterium]|nr:hypothetical protein [Candidatus Hydrogenedentota bacterium]